MTAHDTTRTGLVIESAEGLANGTRGLRYRVWFTDGTRADTMNGGPFTAATFAELADRPVTITLTPAGRIRAIEREPDENERLAKRRRANDAELHRQNLIRDSEDWPPGVTFGQLTTAQKCAAIHKAGKQLTAELAAAAPEISRIMDQPL